MRPNMTSLATLLLTGSLFCFASGDAGAAVRGGVRPSPGILRAGRLAVRPFPIPRYADVTYGAGTLGGAENQLGGGGRFVVARGASYDQTRGLFASPRHGGRSWPGGRGEGFGYGGLGYGVPPIWAGGVADPAGLYPRSEFWGEPVRRTTIGIPPSPVAPAAIYVIGDKSTSSRRSSDRSIQRMSEGRTAPSGGAYTAAPLLIRLSSGR